MRDASDGDLTARAQWGLLQKNMAYVARYGHQQRSEIRAMPLSVFARWVDELSQIVMAENGGDE